MFTHVGFGCKMVVLRLCRLGRFKEGQMIGKKWVRKREGGVQ